MFDFEKAHQLYKTLSRVHQAKQFGAMPSIKKQSDPAKIEEDARILLNNLKQAYPEASDNLDKLYEAWNNSPPKSNTLEETDADEEALFGYQLPFNMGVYEALLPLCELMYQFEQNGKPEQHAYKLAAIFDNSQDALAYIAQYKKQHPGDIPLMHDANLFALPIGEHVPVEKRETVKETALLDWNIWRAIAAKQLNTELFRENILPQAVDIEASIREVSQGKKVIFAPIEKARKEVEKFNKESKDLRDRSKRDTPELEAKYQELRNKLIEARLALAELPITFDEKIPLMDLAAHQEKLQQEGSPLYQYFSKWGLTKRDYNLFLQLERKDDDAQIPNITIDGATIGYPGYYMMKVPVMDENHAARAACFGKMTNCCQSLSGEAGQPCTIHGLTSIYGGFYALCRGDVKNPQVSDPVVAQSWTWRSKGNALVFDSEETSVDAGNIADEDVKLIKTFYRKMAKTITENTSIRRLITGATSGISALVSVPGWNSRNEEFIDYDGYCDSKKQLVIYDKDQPFLLYDEEDFAKADTVNMIDECFKNQTPLMEQKNFINLVNWAMLNNKGVVTQLIERAIKHQRNGEYRNFYDTCSKYMSMLDNQDASGLAEAINAGKYIDLISKDGNNALLVMILHQQAEMIDRLLLAGSDVNISSNNQEMKPLLLAVYYGNKELVEKLIAHGADVNLPTTGGITPLEQAIRNKRSEIVEVLINNKVNVNKKGSDGLRPVMSAMANGNDDLVKKLIAHGADLKLINDEGQDAFFYALAQRKLSRYQHFFELMDPNLKDDRNRTVLMLAAAAGDESTCRMLIEKGADVNLLDDKGKSALMYAVEQNSTTIITMLIEAGCDVNLPTTDDLTPFQAAISKNQLEILEILIENGVDINKKGAMGWRPIMQAMADDNDALVKMLIEHGADLKLENNQGEDVYFFALDRGKLSRYQHYFSESLDPNLKNPEERTLLMRAVIAGDESTCKRLIAKGADVNLQDNEGKSALMYAAERQSTSIVEMLIKAGANVNQKSKYEEGKLVHHPGCKNALMLAAWAGHSEIVALLLANGADPNSKTENNTSALMFAIPNHKCVKALISNSQLKINLDDLVYAIKWGTPEIIKTLLETGVDPTGEAAKVQEALNSGYTKYSPDIVNKIKSVFASHQKSLETADLPQGSKTKLK